MRAVVVAEPGGPEQLQWREVADPGYSDDEVLVQVAAAGVNRADLLQRRGHYPPPAGASAVLGLEVSGTVVAVGAAVTRWTPGDQVAALLAGGGYAELVAVPGGQLLPVPRGVDLVTAAALPEVACTVWSNLVSVARVQAGETLLVHGGGSGIGTFAVQVARELGLRVLVTVGSTRKATVALGLGAEHAINYRDSDFVEAARAATGGHGVDVILDVVGAAYLDRNLRALAAGGRLVVIGLQGGTKAELDLGRLLARRASVHGTTLRARPTHEKALIVADVEAHVWPMLERGSVRAVVDRVIPAEEAATAHQVMEDGENVGKLLLRMPDPA
ncbi:MAG: NAD(P)H-quinone oxidoreductase [Actinomycetes bacterium]